MQREVPRVRTFAAVLLLLLSLTPVAPVEAQEKAWGRPSDQPAAVRRSRVRIGFIGLEADRHAALFTGKAVTWIDLSQRATPRRGHELALTALLAGMGTNGFDGAEFFVASGPSREERTEQAKGIVEAVDWMKKIGVDVLIIGYGNTEDEFVNEALRRLAANGTTIVAIASRGG
jgi:hypothetical protein